MAELIEVALWVRRVVENFVKQNHIKSLFSGKFLKC
jgi:hypothetical protein